MIRRWTKLYTFVWVLASVLVGCGAGNQTEKPVIWKCVRVERVIDGDTFVYTDPHAVKVRLIGIDAPEMRGKEGVQPFAQKATAWLRAQIDQKEVCLELDVDSHDRYERLLAYVYLKDGTFINRQSIEQGYARVLRIKPNTKYATSFQAWQKTALQQQRGIWQTK